MIAGVDAPPELALEYESRLGSGPASAEAIAVLLRREGARLDWGEPLRFSSIAELARFSREQGRLSVKALRVDASLLPELYVGSWFAVRWQHRLVRRYAIAAHRFWPRVFGLLPRRRLLQLAVDATFWAGVRSAATAREWRRLTRSCYTVLYFHRIAGERRPGEDRMDISPRRFARQMRLLARLRFRPLSASEVIAFHERHDAVLPRRSYVVTVDDGFRDAVEVLRSYGFLRAQVFVCTGAVGGEAYWAQGERLAGWSELEELSRMGAAVGSHARSHTVLPDLTAERLESELAGSRRDLAAHLRVSAPILAYPHGRHNEAVRTTAGRAGYHAAYTTQPGKNGAGTDPLILRRVGPKEWDSALSLLWKALTGELVPAPWDRLLIARARLASRLLRSRTRLRASSGASPRSEARTRRRLP
jgi:peptidoglycan/xylan/chitin deacetylase (PgdA/CDA1 family)